MLNTPISKLKFAVLDFETTGLGPWSGGEFCEVGIVQLDNGEVTGSIGTLVKSRAPIRPLAENVHGITNAMLKDAPTTEEILPEIIKRISNRILVVHNARFDCPYLLSACLKYNGKTVPELIVLDTLILSRKLYQNRKGHSLSKILERFEIDTPRSHRALDDADATAKVLFVFLNEIISRGGDKLSDIEEHHGQLFRFPQDFNEKKKRIPDEIFHLIENAIDEDNPLQLKYYSAFTNRVTKRIINPISLDKSRGRFYLHAFCHLENESRTFRLDRIKHIKEV